MSFLEHLPAMTREWEAWTEFVVPELRKLGVDVNDQTALIAAIEYWGECLVQLRVQQTTEERLTAFKERKEKLTGGGSGG